MSWEVGFWWVGGLAALVVGAEAVVRGAARLAAAAGVSSLVIGLTVVAFGTSSPELAVTVRAALAGTPDIALGNVVGSNIFNVLGILGLCAAIAPLVVARQLVWLDVPLMVGSGVLLLAMALDGAIGRLDGLILFSGIVAYTVFVVRLSRRETQALRAAAAIEAAPPPVGVRGWMWNLALVVVGLALLMLGAGWLVDAAVALARVLGMSELIIALTIVAVGTSLPEVATSVVGSLRGERDLAAGNAVGSCLFNTLAILGVAALCAPDGIRVAPAALRFDIPVMVASAVACLPITMTHHRIARWEGFLFLAYYACYVVYLILDATEHDALPAYSAVMMLFVLPLTAATLAVMAYRAWRARGGPAGATSDA